MVNTLSELQKRAIAYSGQADIGDVPPLYAAQRAAQQAAAEQALSGAGAGGASGGGGVVPLASAAGGGAVGGSADFGLPGTTGDPVMDEALASGYRQTILSGRADPRGPAGRDAQNPEVESFLSDYFGFLENPAVIGASVPVVGSFANTFGPYFGAEGLPEPAPLGPIDLITYLAQKALGGGDSVERAGTGIAAPNEKAAADIARELNRQMGLNPNLGSGLLGGGGGGFGGGGREGGDRGPGGPGGAPGGAQGMGM